MKNNNFDILRLYAAISIMLIHTNDYFYSFSSFSNIFNWIYHNVLQTFPGVPIFFILVVI